MKTILTASALALVLAVPAGAAHAGMTCQVQPADRQSWAALVQLAQDYEWTISKMQIDDGCYVLDVLDVGGNALQMTVDPATLELIDGQVKRWADGSLPA